MSIGHDRATLIAAAIDAGFDPPRFATAGETPRFDAFRAFLDRARPLDLGWIGRELDVREDPRRKLRSARTAMVLSVSHHHAVPPDPGGWTGRVARYAWGRDYHNLVGKRLKKLRKRLRLDGVDSWGSVDIQPVVERVWAEAAGVGFVGKNTLIIRPARTSYLLLAVLFLPIEVAADPPMTRDHCGRCARCLVGCPTAAFPAPYVLDPGRCISYWTIEAKDLAPAAILPGFGRWVFGCDACQEVCPHNAAPPPSDEEDLRPVHAWLDLEFLARAADDEIEARFAGTPLARPGAPGLRRNALVALGNTGDPAAEVLLSPHRSHPDPVVARAATWALARLDDFPSPLGPAPR